MGVWAPLDSDGTRWSQWHLCATHRSGRGGLVPTTVAGAASGAQCPQLEGREGQSSGPGSCHCCGCECPPGAGVPGCVHCHPCTGLAAREGPCGDTPGRAAGPGCGQGGQRGCAGTWGTHEGRCVLSPVTSCLCQRRGGHVAGWLVFCERVEGSTLSVAACVTGCVWMCVQLCQWLNLQLEKKQPPPWG